MSSYLTNIKRGAHLHSGKVRELYGTNQPGRLLVEASDRISIFDVQLGEPVPGKGTVLTHMSQFWFTQVLQDVSSHYIGLAAPNAMVVHAARMLPIECIVRGYLTGSGLKDYNATGAVCGIELPPGLVEASRLEEPIFTPSTKEDRPGMHDENVTDEMAVELCVAAGFSPEDYYEARAMSLRAYNAAAEHALGHGIIIADTKFEIGDVGGELVLADEVLTPDSSRFWWADSWEPGKVSPSLDKQPVRDWGQAECDAGRWDKTAPAPPCPDEVIEATVQRYIEAAVELTGVNPLAG